MQQNLCSKSTEIGCIIIHVLFCKHLKGDSLMIFTRCGLLAHTLQIACFYTSLTMQLVVSAYTCIESILRVSNFRLPIHVTRT